MQDLRKPIREAPRDHIGLAKDAQGESQHGGCFLGSFRVLEQIVDKRFSCCATAFP